MKRLIVVFALIVGLLAVATPISAGVSPGIVTVGNYQNGLKVDYDITIFNNSDTEQTYLVAFKIPDNTRSKEYIKAPAEASNWVKISNPSPTVSANSSKAINITFQAPHNAKTPSKWEFQISTIQTGQGNVQVEELVRWLIEEPYKWNMTNFYFLIGFIVFAITIIISYLYKRELQTIKVKLKELTKRK